MPLTFEQFVPGAGWKLVYCAPGTAFNHSSCACTDLLPHPALSSTCRAELYLPFKGDVKDESGNNNFVQNEGVKVINGAGYFDGSSVLRVPRFANADYGDYVLIRLRYKQEAGGGGRQALVANGDCLKPSSLYMVAGAQRMYFGSLTTTGGHAAVNVSSTFQYQ
ncbi:protein PIF-like [Babylonia areolata]|uniref:protein PIF-like n=1 Tax=Babylonia areolata TaxID=304850 RepID=UPI003FD47DA0